MQRGTRCAINSTLFALFGASDENIENPNRDPNRLIESKGRETFRIVKYIKLNK